MAIPQNLQMKTQHIRANWARHCNTVLYMSSETTDVPTMGLRPSGQLMSLCPADCTSPSPSRPEWFRKADDVVVENLRHLLCGYGPKKPVCLGPRFRVFVQQGYMSGGAGYRLSREVLWRFVQGKARQGKARQGKVLAWASTSPHWRMQPWASAWRPRRPRERREGQNHLISSLEPATPYHLATEGSSGDTVTTLQDKVQNIISW
ncbi:glycoprotein-N-acetylgalactosamine 3-beta-galactosyltransferase 1 [Electrophorus electricus]|uniref:glycoprotein-N-acetylgalactosamine 3-beta-galactosyltransferase 1 n=1 Tax=Electrophorus electricus TaxID=8005 RepID=UPI0015D02F76|nr:glycoprotein-N-acetylgalactosamine 3-beta-galactosyltransferase 1 [Electrophorus electricus]